MTTMNEPDGLDNLEKFLGQMATLPEDKTIPIVLVPGFSGWGSPLFGAINYWGGIESMPKTLMTKGYTVVVTPIAPLSTNWERACELYRSLTFGKFSRFDDTTNETKDYFDVDVSYGRYFDSDPDNGPDASSVTGRRRAVLFSKSPEKYENWKWSGNNKVHFVCHSQGGNTARYLISLMDRSSELHPDYFGVRGRGNWVVSMTTLGTPHRGTTVIDVLKNIVPDLDIQVNLLANVFATMVYQDPKLRAYDLQLDHWGICRQGTESFEDLRKRFQVASGPIGKWLHSNHNGFFDNSIEGVNKLHLQADPVCEHVYYFSLSFHATVPFPTKWPNWTVRALNEFPVAPIAFIRSVVEYIPGVNLAARLVDHVLGKYINKLEWKILSSLVSIRSLVTWLTDSVANNFLNTLGYSVQLPLPGKYLPRTDIIPFMIPTCYAMGGLDLTPKQRELLGPNLGDWYQNDGIVNTESMRGPSEGVVQDISAFPLSRINSDDARGVYWHFGTNDKMDHADEIGVFIADDTVHSTRNMYLNIAGLVSRLPSSRDAPNQVINGPS